MCEVSVCPSCKNKPYVSTSNDMECLTVGCEKEGLVYMAYEWVKLCNKTKEGE